MKEEIKERKTKLEKQSAVMSIEVACLELEIGEAKEFKLKDLETLQSLKTRFNRIKNSLGRSFSTELTGSKVIVTRIENDGNTRHQQ